MLAPGLINLDLYAPRPDCSTATIQIAVPTQTVTARAPRMRADRSIDLYAPLPFPACRKLR